ncbi:MAG: hypothetical protein R3D43_00330 [Tepidamorphaceae bacterium]
MAEVATPGKKTAAKKPAKKPAPKPSKKPALPKAEAPVDDGGLREDDRARLKALVEQRQKKEAAARRAEKKAAKPETSKSAETKATPQKSGPDVKEKSRTRAAEQPPGIKPAALEMDHGWRWRMRRLHEILLDRLGRNPERVSTASHSGSGHGLAATERVSPRKVVNWALDLLPDEPKGYTFVDMGCGRGRVVLEASRRPFDKIIGIERDFGHYENAMLNLRHWPRSIMACRDVDIVYGNAATWKLPQSNLVVYLFDPFDEKTMFNLVSRLNHHVENGHKAAVIYLDATFTLPLRESPYFRQVIPLGMHRRKIETFSPYTLEVYASAQPDTPIQPRKTRRSR